MIWLLYPFLSRVGRGFGFRSRIQNAQAWNGDSKKPDDPALRAQAPQRNRHAPQTSGKRGHTVQRAGTGKKAPLATQLFPLFQFDRCAC